MAELVVADDEAWRDCLGVSPMAEDISGDEYVRELRIPGPDAELVQVTWDVTDDSVRIRHHRDGRIVADLFREMATLLTVARTGLGAEVILEYGSDGWLGRARVRVRPTVLIDDQVLRS
ncbi:hypothetical protein KOI35_11915 [Actinoplanes bogorensis]|uniref:Uncharacterized protein n=1 Tax=Paractinoplanes bogorensis TaxID=1610840 RepID=A0ABS5YL56_9ACTN|nr:hypothetical protein [Actinoplanes bogorensis]MBU2664198.1 hypothetical protein [Actinoplanes bogorensis]